MKVEMNNEEIDEKNNEDNDDDDDDEDEKVVFGSTDRRYRKVREEERKRRKIAREEKRKREEEKVREKEEKEREKNATIERIIDQVQRQKDSEEEERKMKIVEEADKARKEEKELRERRQTMTEEEEEEWDKKRIMRAETLMRRMKMRGQAYVPQMDTRGSRGTRVQGMGGIRSGGRNEGLGANAMRGSTGGMENNNERGRYRGMGGYRNEYERNVEGMRGMRGNRGDETERRRGRGSSGRGEPGWRQLPGWEQRYLGNSLMNWARGTNDRREMLVPTFGRGGRYEMGNERIPREEYGPRVLGQGEARNEGGMREDRRMRGNRGGGYEREDFLGGGDKDSNEDEICTTMEVNEMKDMKRTRIEIRDMEKEGKEWMKMIRRMMI